MQGRPIAACKPQGTALREFRAALEQHDLLFDGYRDDITLCRFLKARRWSPTQALVMWREMYAWRAQHIAPVNPPFSSAEIDDVRAFRRNRRSIVMHVKRKITRDRPHAITQQRARSGSSRGPSARFWRAHAHQENAATLRADQTDLSSLLAQDGPLWAAGLLRAPRRGALARLLARLAGRSEH